MDERESRFLTRLNFEQYPRESLEALLHNVGEVEPEDEVAILAQHTEEPSGEPLAARLPVEILYNPDAPEQMTYGIRLLQYAGWITDHAQVVLLTDLITEIVKTSTTGVRQFVDWVAMTWVRLAIGAAEEDLSGVGSFLALASQLASIYATTHQVPEFLERFHRTVFPRSVLIMDKAGHALDERATGTAQRLRVLLRLPQEGHILKRDFTTAGADTPELLHRMLEILEAGGETLVLLNLDRLSERIGTGPMEDFVRRAGTLPGGLVATTHFALSSLLPRFFDLFLSGSADLAPAEDRPSTTEAIRGAVKKIEEPSSPALILREVACLSLTRDRTLKLNLIRKTSGYHKGKEFLDVWCNAYRQRDETGNPIAIGPGAVDKALGGPLSEQDYQEIAMLVQNDKVVGPGLALACSRLIEALRNAPDQKNDDFYVAVFKLLGFTTCSEIVTRALRWFATGMMRQPFETF